LSQGLITLPPAGEVPHLQPVAVHVIVARDFSRLPVLFEIKSGRIFEIEAFGVMGSGLPIGSSTGW